MKKSVLLILTILGVTCFASCGTADNPVKPDDPVIEETPDGYVDVLPNNIGDSPILHAFCWKFKDIEDNLNTIKENGFKSVQISPVQQPKGGGSSWWSYYQPLSFSIADNSMLGTKEDLISLCASAHEKGISIIADLVCNHLANINDDELEADGTVIQHRYMDFKVTMDERICDGQYFSAAVHALIKYLKNPKLLEISPLQD